MKKEHLSPQHYRFLAKIRTKRTQYITTATTHGVSKIYSEYKIESCFWIWVVLIGVLLSILGTSTLISKYYAYDIYTSVSRKVSENDFFPSVTFCDFELMIQNYYTYCGVRFGSRVINANLPCLSIVWNLPEIKNILDSKTEWSNGLFHVKSCASIHHNYGERKGCASDKYLKSLSKHDNYCFTWNYNGDFHDEFGHVDITLTLNSTSGRNFSKLFAAVHDPGVTELQLMFPTFLQTSRAYQLYMQTVEINRLKYPYPSNCTDKKINDIFSGKYTRTNCVDSLNYLAMLKVCGDAFDYVKRYLPKDLLRIYERNTSMKEAWACMQKFAGRKLNSTVNCPVPCREIEVHTVPSFYNIHTEDKGLYTVEIIHNKFNSYKVINERPVYTWEQLAGEIGGFLGLIVGASFVSLIELCVYILLLVVEKCTAFFYIKPIP